MRNEEPRFLDSWAQVLLRETFVLSADEHITFIPHSALRIPHSM